MIKGNIQNIKSEIGNVKLVVVTKSRSIDEIKEAIESGAEIMGENRIQEAEEKYEQIKKYDIEFHFIGHLQTNKVKKAVEMFDMIQSVDSVKLAKEIDKRAGEINKIQRVLIQINIGEEKQKYGIAPGEIDDFMSEISALKNINAQGLMCMPPFGKDPRPYFIKMKQIYDRIRGSKGDIPIIKSDKNSFNILSMGMSSDYKIAIEEGSNMVRIGTKIFGERK